MNTSTHIVCTMRASCVRRGAGACLRSLQRQHWVLQAGGEVPLSPCFYNCGVKLRSIQHEGEEEAPPDSKLKGEGGGESPAFRLERGEGGKERQSACL